MAIQASLHTITFSAEIGLKLRNTHPTAKHKARLVIYPLSHSDFHIWPLQLFLCQDCFSETSPLQHSGQRAGTGHGCTTGSSQTSHTTLCVTSGYGLCPQHWEMDM